MGDRCYLQLCISKTDKGSVLETIGDLADDVTDEDDGCVSLEFYEANYAFADELRALVSNEVLFYGYHCRGDNYGPEAFAFDGETYAEVCTDEDQEPTIRVLDNGSIDDGALVNARKYQKILANAKEKIKRKGT